MRNYKCYAHSLNNCSGGITAEHIISKTLLGKLIDSNPNGITKKIGRNSYKVKILCKNHNNQLGELDNQIKQYHIWLVEDASCYEQIKSCSTIPQERVFHLRGEHLEKWLLKSAINYKCYMDGKSRSHFNYSWVAKRLFQDIPFEFPFGLSQFQLDIPLTHMHPGEISFTYTYDNNEIYGITINLQGTYYFICLPTENVHNITRMGVELHGIRYFPRASIPARGIEELKNPTLLWHPGGIKTMQENLNGEKVVRSTVIFNWNQEVYQY